MGRRATALGAAPSKERAEPQAVLHPLAGAAALYVEAEPEPDDHEAGPRHVAAGEGRTAPVGAASGGGAVPYVHQTPRRQGVVGATVLPAPLMPAPPSGLNGAEDVSGVHPPIAARVPRDRGAVAREAVPGVRAAAKAAGAVTTAAVRADDLRREPLPNPDRRTVPGPPPAATALAAPRAPASAHLLAAARVAAPRLLPPGVGYLRLELDRNSDRLRRLR